MTLLYHDPCFLKHETGSHPECPQRIQGLAERPRFREAAQACCRPAWEAVSRPRLERNHTPWYIEQVRSLAASGGGELDSETIVGRASYEVALLAVGAVCDATERIIRGEDRRALCVVRPPGHHALASEAMGFCLFNNVAVAAQMAIEEFELQRLLIVDWDVHHGNGTQATFWEDPRVGLLSIHRWPFFPGTGDKDEQGGGAGLGTTLNLPIAYGTPRREILATFSAGLESLAAKIKPELVLVSAGFDGHRLDPIGDLGLETEDFATMTQRVREVADADASGRLVSVLEGGYDAAVLADCLAAHLKALLPGGG